MNVGATLTRQFNKKEIIELIDKTFTDDTLQTICVITQVSEYHGEKRQSILFSENFEL